MWFLIIYSLHHPYPQYAPAYEWQKTVAVDQAGQQMKWGDPLPCINEAQARNAYRFGSPDDTPIYSCEHKDEF